MGNSDAAVIMHLHLHIKVPGQCGLVINHTNRNHGLSLSRFALSENSK